MSPSVRRGFTWAVLVLAGLVVLGIFLQVYFIASYFFGAGEDALDAHTGLGFWVHNVEVLAFLAAIVAYWRRWAGLLMPFLLALIGTAQLALTESDEWVGGLHGLLALVVLFLAHDVARRAVRDLGLWRHRAAGGAGSS
jgi:hypothetical protein